MNTKNRNAGILAALLGGAIPIDNEPVREFSFSRSDLDDLFPGTVKKHKTQTKKEKNKRRMVKISRKKNRRK